MNVLEVMKFIEKRAEDIYDFATESNLEYLGFHAHDLLNYDYFYLGYLNDSRCITFIMKETDCNYEITTPVPIKFFEEENWRELLIKDNEVGHIVSIEMDALDEKRKEEKEYNEYLKLKEKFEGR